MFLLKLQSTLIVATLGGLFGFCTAADIGTLTAELMIGMTVALLIIVLITGWWDHPYKEPVVHI